jgi:exo-beta-1,3-glucanase (GH17 family)/cellulose synthase/poly-beta-1,6-N-acetylglucosamine synthase-like glycosyltransferase
VLAAWKGPGFLAGSLQRNRRVRGNNPLVRKTKLPMTRDNVLITIAVSLLTLGMWALVNMPEEEPPWPKRIQGFCFQPMRADHDPTRNIMPTVDEVAEDLDFLEGRTYAVRTYSVDGVLGEVPRLAASRGINVAVGAWLDADLEKNEREIARLIEMVPQQTNVVRVVLGNEAVLRGDLTVAQMTDYLDRVRAALGVPVSTAEPWHVWIKNPELGHHVDYLGIHLLPYWEGIGVDAAVDVVIQNVKDVQATFPGIPVVLAEVGWPSNGRMRRGAVASEANQATFLRRFLDRAREEKYIYYVMEAFDQPWKAADEGAVGAYWGVWDVYRQAKFEFIAPIVEIPQWRVLAAASVAVAVAALGLLLFGSRALSRRGRSFLALIAFAAATTVVWIAYDYTRQYLTLSSAAIGMFLLAGTVLFFLLTLTEAHEWAETVWVQQRFRRPRLRPAVDGPLPAVSIHVPCYNEPPALVIQTLDALHALEYPNFEVIVVDNNTKDPEVWQPVQAHCEKLGARFRFFHVDPLAGYKAGALNFALAKTRPDADIVAVIDSDYAVSPNWLCDLVPQFSSTKVAIVQAPQDYRDGEQNAFKALCYAEYSGFFYFGMQTRNERNAIIQHGTMTLVRRSMLEQVGGWAEWCITEDAELGLRILEAGGEALYVPKSYGRGLMPDSFIDYKKQRHRWAYGAVRILREHAGALLGGGRTQLTLGQRYHYVAGWMPWFADALNLVFVGGAIAWSVAMVAAPSHVDPPRLAFSVLPVLLFAFRVLKTLYLYRKGGDATVRQTLAAALAGLSLSHTIGMAVLTGLVRSGRPFFRTPKCAPSQRLLGALLSVRGELAALLLLWGSAGAVAVWGGSSSRELTLWVSMLLVLSMPYVAALLVALLSALPRLSAWWVGPMAMVDELEIAPAAVPVPVTPSLARAPQPARSHG